MVPSAGAQAEREHDRVAHNSFPFVATPILDVAAQFLARSRQSTDFRSQSSSCPVSDHPVALTYVDDCAGSAHESCDPVAELADFVSQLATGVQEEG
mmetsp:Transcript_37067/g.61363  ORF Transcript_37067/g.61363 Transcript_37067/m.61363 type:complete len:97 (+) Transcript_37067:757-1047(+)